MKKTIIFLMMILSISMVLATQESLGDVKQNSEVNITQTCSNCSFINITSIRLGSGSLVNLNEPMTKIGTDYNYTLPSNYTSSLGQYIVYCVGDPNGVLNSEDCIFDFTVTATGRDFDSGESLGAVGILGTALVLSFLFIFLGFKIGAEPKLMPLAFFFVIIGLGLGIYSLNLSWAFSHDILEYESLTPVAETIYLTVLWSVVGLIVIGTALMLMAFIKELVYVVEKRRFGDDWNPLEASYE